MDLLNIGKLNSETLPEAAKLLNDLLQNGVSALNQTLTKLYEVEADAINQLDALSDRKIEKLVNVLTPLLEILESGLKLHGSIGGIPVDLNLTKKV